MTLNNMLKQLFLINTKKRLENMTTFGLQVNSMHVCIETI